ncbi:MAG: M48 family metalloprotease [Smithella sp.]
MRKLIQNQYIYSTLLIGILLFNISPCFAAFTIDDEKKLGREFYDKMEEHKLILKSKFLKDYITQIGNTVLAQSQKAPFDFNFFVVNSSAINAFATPGGYIYINKGLMSAAENEAQLAGVIAHEIGHANARHIASIIDKSQKLNMAAIAATLAGIFLGGGGDTSAAIAAFSLAGSSSLTLRYMREHEEEADRLGLEYLSRAGYYPGAMIDFLKIIKQNEFISKTMPSYLLTHPGTDDRIVNMDALIATQYRQIGAKNLIGNLSRIQSVIPMDPSELDKKNKELKRSLQSSPDNIDLLYYLAVTEDQLGQTDAALQHYQKALRLSPDDEDILRNIGLIYLNQGRINLALEYLLRAKNPQDETVFVLGKAYFATGNYPKALDHFLNLKDRKFDDTDLNYFLAMTYGKLHQQGEFHYYFGLHFKKMNKKESALFHFQQAIKYFPKDSERKNAIDRAIKELNKPDSQRLFRKQP